VTQIDLAGTVGGILGFPARYSIGGSVLGDTLTARRSKEIGGSTIPSRLRVLPAYPNPFNPTSRIEYGIPRRERVVIKIFDTAGREVLTTLDAEQSGGYHEAIVDGSGLSSGAYFFRVRSGTEQAAGRLVLTR
jgi:carbohydrate-binding DOMON domain-containing protein